MQVCVHQGKGCMRVRERWAQMHESLEHLQMCAHPFSSGLWEACKSASTQAKAEGAMGFLVALADVVWCRGMRSGWVWLVGRWVGKLGLAAGSDG